MALLERQMLVVVAFGKRRNEPLDILNTFRFARAARGCVQRRWSKPHRMAIDPKPLTLAAFVVGQTSVEWMPSAVANIVFRGLGLVTGPCGGDDVPVVVRKNVS